MLTINEKKAVSETLNGETIIINLETGTYYSLNQTASAAWEALRSGVADAAALATFLSSQYEAGAFDIQKETAALVDFLAKENLVAKTDGVASELPEGPAGAKAPFVVPEAKRYEDMQEILLADPIHDVDDAGWPILKPKA